MSVSDEVINRLIKALGDIRTELKRIADYHDSVSVRAAESDQKVAEPETDIKYDQFARYVAQKRASGEGFIGSSANGIETKIWHSLVQTLLGVPNPQSIERIKATRIPLVLLERALEAGPADFRNMADPSWQIFRGFMETIS